MEYVYSIEPLNKLLYPNLLLGFCVLDFLTCVVGYIELVYLCVASICVFYTDLQRNNQKSWKSNKFSLSLIS